MSALTPEASVSTSSIQPPPWVWPRAAYIHIPFCAHHCGYCDFAVVAGQDHLMDLYLDALTAELATLGQPQTVHSVFIGGGTPTYFNCRQLEKLLAELRRWFVPWSQSPETKNWEFSVEANPGNFNDEKVGVLADHGVTRISLGSQSFHPHVLRVLERDHAPADVFRA